MDENNDLVLDLLEYYRSAGIDLIHVLDDPVFVNLPIRAKIAAIQSHAQDILHGTPNALSASDKRALITRTALMTAKGAIAGGAAGAALGAATRLGSNTMPVAFGALAGALAGLGGATLDATTNIANRASVKHQLQATATNPTTVNALGVLSSARIAQMQNAYLKEIAKEVSGPLHDTISETALRRHVQGYMTNLNK